MGFNYLFIYFSSQFCCPLRSQDLPQTRWGQCFLVFGNSLFFKTPFPGRISIPTSFVSLFIFYIFSYLLLKTMGCLSVCLMFSASIQKLFCGIFSGFKCSFDEFVGEKVVSQSYFSTILGPPLRPSNLIPWPLGNYNKTYACGVSTRIQKILKSHHCMLQGLKS